jgi:type I restriction enzyme, S subunit
MGSGAVALNATQKFDTVPSQRRFKPYPAYKDSGIEWLGRIPAHWEVKRLRSTVKSCQNGVWGDEPDGLNDVACVRVADFDRVTYRVDMADPTLRSIEPGVVGARGLHAGDLLLEKSGGGENQPVGAVVLYDHDTPAVCSNFIARVTIADRYDPRFLTYLHAALYALRINTRHIKQSTGIQNLDSASYLGEATGLPPEPEQRAIAAFLDRETARIDALVVKKERLIELLQEKRTTLITRAVTKGLNSNVPMKDSGVEWLGMIPTDWDVKRIRHVVHRIEQGWSPECENREAAEDEWGVLKAGCVNRGSFVESEHKALPSRFEPIPELEIAEGDLLMSRASGSRELVGSVAVVPRCRPRLLLCDKVFRLHLNTATTSRQFLAYSMNSRIARWQIEAVLSGGSGLANNIAQEVVKDLILALPAPREQCAIAGFLNRETARIDALAVKVLEAITRLKELRLAFISAAVTGKIDVREEAAA